MAVTSPAVAVPHGLAIGTLVAALPSAVLAVAGIGGAIGAGAALGSGGQAPPLATLAALVLALAVWRRKRAAWLPALSALGAITHVAFVSANLPGATVAGAACLALLLSWTRPDTRFDVRSRRMRALLLVGSVALGAGAVAVTVGSHAVASAILPAIRTWLAFGDVAAAVGGAPSPEVSTVASVAWLVELLAAAAALAPARAPQAGASAAARSAAVLAEHGEGALLPFQVAPDKERFSTDGTAGVVVYGRAWRSAVALGDPIGPPEDAWAAFAGWADEARRLDWRPAVYQASEGARGRLASLGFRTYRVGGEAIVDLGAFDLASPRVANVRHTITRARKGGVSVQWFPDGIRDASADAVIAGLSAVDSFWQRRAGPPLGFTISAYRPQDMHSAAVAVAFGANAAPIAFVTFHRTGRDGGWVVDLMRRMPGGVPGAVEACVAEAIAGMRAAGSSRLSLGLAPLWGLDASGGPTDRFLALCARTARPVYDYPGLAFFKAKFAPRWEVRYIAVRTPLDVPGTLIALVWLHLGGSWRFVVRNLLATARPRQHPARGAASSRT